MAYDGIDSPSPIAILLIWQQPHIIYMLELAYQSGLNDEKGNGDIPNEARKHWRFTLFLAAQWAKRLNKDNEASEWIKVAENMAELPKLNGLYLAHENCPDTYKEFNRDHPMMTAVYGLIDSDRIDHETMLKTLRKIMRCWDFNSMWGWDFAMMAMTATRLGYPELAIDLLLMDTPNNHYVTSGNNSQKKREDLPVYLPGNGSLLLAVALMVASYGGCEEAFRDFQRTAAGRLPTIISITSPIVECILFSIIREMKVKHSNYDFLVKNEAG